MNRACLICAWTLLICAPATFAQEAVDLQMIHRIKQEAFRNSQVMETVFQLTDVVGPRLSASPGMRRAEEWSRKKLEEWGLANARLEPWGAFGKGWQNRKCYVAMTMPYYQHLIAVPEAWSPGTEGAVAGKALLLKVEKEEDLDKYRGKLAGRIVVMWQDTRMNMGFEPEARRYTDEELEKMVMERAVAPPDGEGPQRPDYSRYRELRKLRKKAEEMMVEEGVALVIAGARGSMGTVFTSNGSSYKWDAGPAVPVLETSAEHLNRLVRLLEKGIEVEMEAEVVNEFLVTDSLEYNVIAEIQGTDKKLKEEVVMLGGHLDSWHGSTGATDNATGCAVMMEAVRILKTLGVQPRRTIRIALWSGEEQGLHGSKNYVEKHFGDRKTMTLKPEHDKFCAYYNLDNGAGRIRGIYLQGNDALRPVFEAWLAPFRDMGVTTVTTRSTGSTDHVPFDRLGLPGFQFIQDPLQYWSHTHHTNMDSYDRVVEEDLVQASVIVAAVVYHTAMRGEKLPRKPLPEVRD